MAARRSATRSPLLCTAIASAAARRSVRRRKSFSRHSLRGGLNRGRARVARLAQDRRWKEGERGSTNRGRLPVRWCDERSRVRSLIVRFPVVLNRLGVAPLRAAASPPVRRRLRPSGRKFLASARAPGSGPRRIRASGTRSKSADHSAPPPRDRTGEKRP